MSNPKIFLLKIPCLTSDFIVRDC